MVALQPDANPDTSSTLGATYRQSSSPTKSCPISRKMRSDTPKDGDGSSRAARGRVRVRYPAWKRPRKGGAYDGSRRREASPGGVDRVGRDGKCRHVRSAGEGRIEGDKR